MRTLVVFLLLSIKFLLLYSQTPRYPRDSAYNFLFFEGQISDTSKLELKVKYKNYDKQNILIHKNLIDAIEYGQVGNFYLDMERLKEGEYEKFVDKSVDYILMEERPQDRSYYNELRPGDSAVLKFNLISRIGAFYKGKYRMRINLLKVPNNYPIRYEIDYATSRWFYFEVIKDLDYHDIYNNVSY